MASSWCVLHISPVKQHIYNRSLDFDETTEPKQLRSTGSLKEVTYAELEMDFNPPDITSDMYDNTMDDLDYMTFCARTTLGVEYPNEDIPGRVSKVVADHDDLLSNTLKVYVNE